MKQKIKRYIGVILVGGLLMGLGYLIRRNVLEVPGVDSQCMTNQQEPLSETKQSEVMEFALRVVDKHPIEGHAMVPIEEKLVAHDQYDRYLIEISAVAINQNSGSGLYTYYIVIQESQREGLYVLPFGVEVIKENTEALKREIIISMMKVVNGWGSSPEEFESRWTKAFALSGNNQNKSSKQSDELDLKHIYDIQNILRYMNNYLIQYQYAIENSDPSVIKDFLGNAPSYYEEQSREIKNLERKGIVREVMQFEIVEISKLDEMNECTLVTNTELSNYSGERGWNTIEVTEFRLRIQEEVVEILNVCKIVNK